MKAPLPPAIEMLLGEFSGRELEFETVARAFRDDGFLDDFHNQCIAGLETHAFADRVPPGIGTFDLFATGCLDPLSAVGKCEQPPCRVAYAEQFAGTACLYADRVVLPDPFSFGSYLRSNIYDVFSQVLVLKTLRPLIDAGIIVFGPASYGVCDSCSLALKRARKLVSLELWQQFTSRPIDVFRFKHDGHWRLSFGSHLFAADGEETRLTVRASRAAISLSKAGIPVPKAASKLLLKPYAKSLQEHFSGIAHQLVYSCRVGGLCGSTVATNSRQEAIGFRVLEGRRLGLGVGPDWSNLRTVPLPAFKRLTVSQALALRSEAATALPAFRAKIQRELVSLRESSDESENQRARAVAAELTEAAAELRGEMSALHIRSKRRSERLLLSLALALEVVGLTTANPESAKVISGSLMALLLAAHKSKQDREDKHATLVHRPAYVLLTAERLHGKHA